MTKKELIAKIKAMGSITKDQRNMVVCSLIGHSNIIENCFGYISCSRCKQQIGDALAGCYSNENAVIVGHNCKTCKKNFKKLSWKDKLYVPDPFKKKKGAK